MEKLLLNQKVKLQLLKDLLNAIQNILMVDLQKMKMGIYIKKDL